MSDNRVYLFHDRFICSVFDEMRECCKTGNYSYLPGLIEEAQTMANRMENALSQQKGIKEVDEAWHKAKAKNKFLNEALDKWEQENESEVSDK